MEDSEGKQAEREQEEGGGEGGRGRFVGSNMCFFSIIQMSAQRVFEKVRRQTRCPAPSGLQLSFEDSAQSVAAQAGAPPMLTCGKSSLKTC